MKIYSSNISNVVRAHRAVAGLTQQDLNKVLSPKARNSQFWSNIERGKCGLPAKYAPQVAVKLGVPLETLRRAMIEDFIECLDTELATAVGAL